MRSHRDSPRFLRLLILLLVVHSSSGLLALTGQNQNQNQVQLQLQGKLAAPTFIQEPPNRVDFLNELGVSIPCEASSLPGFSSPEIQWLSSDNKILENIPNFRTVHPNGTLQIHPFPPAAYRQDLHTTTVRCTASSTAGVLRSRDVQIRAVVAQQWTAKVKVISADGSSIMESSSSHILSNNPPQSQNANQVGKPKSSSSSRLSSPVLFKCEIELIGGGRDFIEILGWKWGPNPNLLVKPHSVAGDRLRFHLLPNGDLLVDRLTSQDISTQIVCMTRHKLTDEQVLSPPFSLRQVPETSRDSSIMPGPNLADRFPEPIVVHEGESIILHCLVGSSFQSGPVRWEKSNGGAWLELLKFSLDKSIALVGNSLVILKGKRSHSGQYRCSNGVSSGQGQGQLQSQGQGQVPGQSIEYHVRVLGDALSVRVSIHPESSPLGSSCEMVCTTSFADQPVSITWLKDDKVINPGGGRYRLLANNILQISQIQSSDQGIFQCLVRERERERESAQSAVRLQLADSPSRLALGFLDQTLGGPGPDISLRCVFHSGFPTPKVSWTIDGFPPVSPDPRIIVGDHVTSHGDIITYYNITGTRIEDGGLYSCAAINRVATVKHSARLNIYGAPWVRNVPPVQAIQGESLEIQCPVSGYPIAGINWEKDGLKLPLNPRQRVASNGTLTISPVERVTAGTYSCSAWDSQGRTARNDVQVNVVAPLRIATFAEKSQVVEFDRVSLLCVLSSGLGQIRWTKLTSSGHRKASNVGESTVFRHSNNNNNINKMNSNVITINDINNSNNNHNNNNNNDEEASFTVLATDGFTSLLSIPAASPAHAGTYVCTASDSLQTVTRTHELTVLVPVKIEPFSFQEGLREGSRSRLVCGVTQGDIPITINFLKDGFGLVSGGEELRVKNMSITSLDPWSSVLQFSHLTSAHSGIYTCHVSNSGSQSELNARLQVLVGPKWVQEPRDLNVSRGDEALFPCLGQGVPTPSTAKWLKSTGDGLDMKWRPVETLWPSSSVQILPNGSLHFSEVDERHESNYLCKIENGVGSGLSKVVFLKVDVPPYFTKALERQSVSQGKSHEVTCEAHGDFPMTVTWTKGSTVFDSVPANRLYTTTHREGKKTRVSLVMKNLDPILDSGVYQCTANNSMSKISQEFELHIFEKPKAPENLKVLEVSSRFVLLQWDPPPPQQSAPSTPTHHPSRDGTLNEINRDVDLYPGSVSAPAPAPAPVLMYVVEYAPVLQGGDKSTFPIQRLEVLGGMTQAKVQNLLPSLLYNFQVSAVNSAGSGSSVATAVRTLASPPSGPPTFVRVRALTSSSILLNWSPVGAELAHGIILGYQIFASSHSSNGEEAKKLVVPTEALLFPSTSSSSSSSTFKSLSSNSNSSLNSNNQNEEDYSWSASHCCQYALIGLTAFSQYEIQIAGLNSAGVGPNSQPVLVQTLEHVATSPVRSLGCTRLSSQSLQLSWQPPAVSNGVINSYKILYFPIASSFRAIDTHQSPGLTTVISGLLPYTNYSVRITAMNSAGESPYWTGVFCRTLEEVPGSPGDFVGYASSETSVYLNWIPPRRANGVLTHYTVYFRTVDKGSEPFESKRKVSPSADSYAEGQLDLNHHKYVFWITASNSKGESLPSSQIVFTPPPEVEPRLVGQTRRIEIHQGEPLSLHCGLIGWDSISSSSFHGHLDSSSDSTGNGVGGDESESGNGNRGGSRNSPGYLPSIRWTTSGGRPIPLANGNVFMKPGQSELIFLKVRKADNNENYTCQLDGGNAGYKRMLRGNTAVTYMLRVKGPPSTPSIEYRLENRQVLILWSIPSDGRRPSHGHGHGQAGKIQNSNQNQNANGEDAPLGFTLLYRSLGSVQEWNKVEMLPTARNYTLRDLACGSIVNLYMMAYNEVGKSGDSAVVSIDVSHQIAAIPPASQTLLVNSTSVRLNLYPLNANTSFFCPTTFFSVSIRESRSRPSEWLSSSGKEEKIPFTSEYVISGLSEATSYEILITTFGHSTSKSAVYSFVTRNRYGELPSVDVATKNMVRDYSPFYANLTLIIPIVIAILAVLAALGSVLAYWKTRRVVDHIPTLSLTRQAHALPSYETSGDSKASFPHHNNMSQRANEFYATLPCPPPCHPNVNVNAGPPLSRLDGSMLYNAEIEDISPYATFQLSGDPMNKFHEEGFSQEIVVPKFYDVMQQQTYRPQTCERSGRSRSSRTSNSKQHKQMDMDGDDLAMDLDYEVKTSTSKSRKQQQKMKNRSSMYEETRYRSNNGQEGDISSRSVKGLEPGDHEVDDHGEAEEEDSLATRYSALPPSVHHLIHMDMNPNPNPKVSKLSSHQLQQQQQQLIQQQQMQLHQNLKRQQLHHLLMQGSQIPFQKAVGARSFVHPGNIVSGLDPDLELELELEDEEESSSAENSPNKPGRQSQNPNPNLNKQKRLSGVVVDSKKVSSNITERSNPKRVNNQDKDSMQTVNPNAPGDSRKSLMQNAKQKVAKLGKTSGSGLTEPKKESDYSIAV